MWGLSTLKPFYLVLSRYSPADAAYCAKFTQRLHELAVPFFPTILYFDTVRQLLSTAIHLCQMKNAVRLC